MPQTKSRLSDQPAALSASEREAVAFIIGGRPSAEPLYRVGHVWFYTFDQMIDYCRRYGVRRSAVVHL